jgi:hypothetical protein
VRFDDRAAGLDRDLMGIQRFLDVFVNENGEKTEIGRVPGSLRSISPDQIEA